MKSAESTVTHTRCSANPFLPFSGTFSKDTFSSTLYMALYTCIGWFFNLFRPKFRAKKKNVAQPRRIFCKSKISWNRISDWLSIVFHFGTENWEGQLKEPPCITGTVRVFQTIFKCLHFDCLFFFVFIFNRWNCVGAHRGFLENFQMFHHCVALPGKASKPQRRSLVSLVDGRLELIIAKFSILMKNKVSEE